MGEMIAWSNARRKLSELKPWPRNPRQIKQDQAKWLVDSFEQFGQFLALFFGERPGRKCRAVDISPACCAIAIQRWVDATGGDPIILEYTG